MDLPVWKKEKKKGISNMENGLLKFVVCGSVDDGKSTLIGHILYDAKLIYLDQEESLALESKVVTEKKEIDYSLLLDGLMAEREQGITIDVAYRFFSTDNRSFIVADAPGHEEYTRNMAVGASFADLCLVVVDVNKGLSIQTKRHLRICALMGIQHFVFAINKMDQVNYDEKVFRQIRSEIRELMNELDYTSLAIIPVSALEGENLIKPSKKMPWNKGTNLLKYLETIDVSGQESESEESFSMFVQRVSRSKEFGRGYQGQVSQGVLKVGDTVTILPSKETTTVTRLLDTDQEVQSISKGQAVTICLEGEHDISRGNVIEKRDGLEVGSLFKATTLWMSDQQAKEGSRYLLKCGTQVVGVRIMRIHHRIDPLTGNHEEVDLGQKNDFIVCDIVLDHKIVFESFSSNKDFGSFLLIDRVDNTTVAAGVIEESITYRDDLFVQMTDITRKEREEKLGQKAITLWMTGLSGAGKSTISNELEKRLYTQGYQTMSLDGDNVRLRLNQDLAFSENDRNENIRRVAEVARLMNDAGLIVITSFITPTNAMRDMAKEIIGDSFVEIYVQASFEECEKRDVKGLYAKARKGQIPNFTGIGSDFEQPNQADIVIDTEKLSVEQSVDAIIEFIQNKII